MLRNAESRDADSCCLSTSRPLCWRAIVIIIKDAAITMFLIKQTKPSKTYQSRIFYMHRSSHNFHKRTAMFKTVIELHDCAAALAAQILQALVDCKKKVQLIVAYKCFFFGGLKKAEKVTQILARKHTVQQGGRRSRRC